MSYQWDEKQYDQLHMSVQKVRECLEDWFKTMESGNILERLPDPFFTPHISESLAEVVCDTLDSEFEREINGWAGTPTGGSFTHPPGFRELPTPQKIALTQQLTLIKAKYGYEHPPVIDYTTYD